MDDDDDDDGGDDDNDNNKLGANAFSTQFSRWESLQAIVGGVTTAVIPSILPAFADDGPPVFIGTLSGSTPTEAAPVAKKEAALVAKWQRRW